MWKKTLLIILCVGAFYSSRLRQYEEFQPVISPESETQPNMTITENDSMSSNMTESENLPDMTTPENETITPPILPRTDETEDLSMRPKNYTLNLFTSETWGDFITDNKNMSLYIFEKDHTGPNFTYNDFRISCYEDCQRIWPPYLLDQSNSQFLLPQGLNRTLLGSRMRNDGRFQYTYNNWPLYYYYQDKNPGDTLGHNLDENGGLWYLLDRFGKPIKKE